jgi:hypothetical protein
MEHSKILPVVDGPDKPALQWALLYPERGQTVTFKFPDGIADASIAEMVELDDGFQFRVRGTFVSGMLKGNTFHGNYSIASRRGALALQSPA